MSKTHINDEILMRYAGKKVYITNCCGEVGGCESPGTEIFFKIEGTLLNDAPYYWYVRTESCVIKFGPEKVRGIWSTNYLKADAPCAIIEIIIERRRGLWF
jgi:hypothetical protein